MKIVENILEKLRTLFPSRLAAFAVAPLLALTIALISGAFTQHASAQTPTTNHPFAVGAFTTATEHVAFAAQQTSSTHLSGHVVQQLATGTDSGPVTCLQVMSNMATVSFTVTNGPDAGQIRSFTVVDNGAPMMGVPMDTYADCGNQGTTECGTNNCMSEALISGNIVVSSGQ